MGCVVVAVASAKCRTKRGTVSVINASGDTVFAVYPEGVRINVGDGLTKGSGNKGGFAVGGFSGGKTGLTEFFRVTPDSVRVYIDTSSTKGSGNKGGFAVGGFSGGKGLVQDFLRVSQDSVRIYIDKNIAKGTGNKGGFAVGGFSSGKSGYSNIFNISNSDSAEIINPSQPRMLWYPVKEAFLAGRVLIESVDSVGTNSWASGFQSQASGNYSQALGFNCTARGNYSTAIGKGAYTNADNSYAFGDGAYTLVKNSYAFGLGAKTTIGYGFGTDEGNFAFGQNANAAGLYCYSFGKNSNAAGTNAFSFGEAAFAIADDAYAFGLLAKASGVGSVALGSKSWASGFYAVAIGSAFFNGDSIVAGGQYAIAVGTGSRAMGNYSVVIGTGPKVSEMPNLVSTGTNSVTIGSYGRNTHNGGFLFGDYNASYSLSDMLSSTANNEFLVRASGGYKLFTNRYLTETKAFYILADNGSVGIGNASPDHKLTITGNNNNLLRLIGTGLNGSSARLTFGDVNKIFIEEDEDNKLKINVVDRLAITGDYGFKVGIDYDNPQYKLTIFGTNVSNKVLQLLGEGTGNAWGAILAFGDDDKTYFQQYASNKLKLKVYNQFDIQGETGFNVNINNVITNDHTVNIRANSSNKALKLAGVGISNEGAILTFGNDDFAYIQEDEDNSLLMYANNRIAFYSSNSAFKVGVKTTNPSALFDIGGGVRTNISANGKNLLVANDAEIDNNLYVDNNVAITGAAKIGANGTYIGSIIKAIPWENLDPIPAGTSLTKTFSVTNAAIGATVAISPGNALPDKLIIAYARVSADNTVEVKFYNASGATIDPDGMSFYITVTY